MSSSREEALFAAALAKAPAERASFLDGACYGDPALRQRLDALLASKEENQGTAPLNEGVAGLRIEEGTSELRSTLLDETPVTGAIQARIERRLKAPGALKRDSN